MELLPPAFELSGGGFAPGQALAPRAPHAHSSRRGTAAASALSNDVDGAVKKRWQEGLFRFMRERGTPIRKVPTLGKKDLDLYTLYHQVTARGGVRRVIANKLWRSIALALALPDSCTDYAFRLRLHYINNLFPYEHFVYFNNAGGAAAFEVQWRALRAPQKARAVGRAGHGAALSTAALASKRKRNESVTEQQLASPPVTPCDEVTLARTCSSHHQTEQPSTPEGDHTASGSDSALDPGEEEAARTMIDFVRLVHHDRDRATRPAMSKEASPRPKKARAAAWPWTMHEAYGASPAWWLPRGVPADNGMAFHQRLY